jgi:hypothetical protein
MSYLRLSLKQAEFLKILDVFPLFISINFDEILVVAKY